MNWGTKLIARMFKEGDVQLDSTRAMIVGGRIWRKERGGRIP